MDGGHVTWSITHNIIFFKKMVKLIIIIYYLKINLKQIFIKFKKIFYSINKNFIKIYTKINMFN